MITDSALPGIWILLALGAIVALMSLCTSCAPSSGGFEFMNEYGRIKYEPVTGAIQVEYHATK
jgi:uncharacterized membrane protein